MAITRYSVDDYEEMVRLGALTENNRVELIRGEIVPKMAIGPKHGSCLKRFNMFLSQRVAGRAIVGIQDPVRLSDSEPEPDVSVLEPRDDYYANGHPQPPDILLLVEFSDSSLDNDRKIMKPLYAEAGYRRILDCQPPG
jgi:hypothetical protein